MKKLSKLKLKQFHEMSESEMKDVIGGHTDSYGPRCSIGSACSVTFVGEYGQSTGSETGTCQQQTSGNTVTCFCNAITYDTPLTNQSGMSHCWA